MNCKKGLTIIELIVVMAIMAILAVISFISVNYILNRNNLKAYDARCNEAVELCLTASDLLNQGIGYVGESIYAGRNDIVTADVMRGMIVSIGIPHEYDIRLTLNNSVPDRQQYQGAPDKDLIIVLVLGLNEPLNETHIEIIGGWLILRGENSPVYTYSHVDRKGYEEGVMLNYE